jgi:hypothetical protein
MTPFEISAAVILSVIGAAVIIGGCFCYCLYGLTYHDPKTGKVNWF